jgi:AcrR family transcriptional regulator
VTSASESSPAGPSDFAGGTRRVLRADGRRSWHQLQKAAIRLVGDLGHDAVTVDDIAAEAGVSRRTFFNHFPTKAAALFDPAPEDSERLATLLEAAVSKSDVWSALGEVCVAFVAGHEDVIAVRRRLAAQSPELDQYHRTAHRHVERELARWAELRLPDDRFRALLMAQTAGAVMISAFEAWQPEDDPALLPGLVEQGFLTIIFAGTG